MSKIGPDLAKTRIGQKQKGKKARKTGFKRGQSSIQCLTTRNLNPHFRTGRQATAPFFSSLHMHNALTLSLSLSPLMEIHGKSHI